MNDKTAFQMFDPAKPEDVRAMFESQSRRIDYLVTENAAQEKRLDDIEKDFLPIKWLFSKITAGIGTAIVLAVGAYFMGLFDG